MSPSEAMAIEFEFMVLRHLDMYCTNQLKRFTLSWSYRAKAYHNIIQFCEIVLNQVISIDTCCQSMQDCTVQISKMRVQTISYWSKIRPTIYAELTDPLLLVLDNSGWKRSAGRVLDRWTEEESYCHGKDPQEETEEKNLSFHDNEFGEVVFLFWPKV